MGTGINMEKALPSKQVRNKVGNYQLVSFFPGYNARQDPTTLPVGTLITPSQNVVIDTSGRVATIAGYVLDGAGSAVIDSGILSNTDFSTFNGSVRNMRAGFQTSALNDGKLQYRYQPGTTVNWVDLATGLTNIRLSFCEYWDTTNLVKLLIWVDGSANVNTWNGSVTTLVSATPTTLTKSGTNTWAQDGFLQTSGTIVVNGVTATYSGGTSTTTLTGVSVDFSATAVGAIIHQAVVVTNLSAFSGIPATFNPTVVGCGRNNQVYYGSSQSNNLYISKVNNFKDCSFTTPVRVVGEGCLIPLDSPPTKFIPQEVQQSESSYDMYISEGLDRWAVIRSTLSADLTGEKLEHIRLKVAPLKGAKSERLATKMKNEIMYVANDNTANFFGFMSYQFVPAITDFSYPIINDMNSYDFTDGSIFEHKNYAYVAIPKAGIIRVYNMTDQTGQYTTFTRDLEDVTQQPWFWESPITYPISGFYVVNGSLYGHSYATSESYKLFTGGSLNGQQIDTNATFSYDDKGDRTSSKTSNELWVEGYIKQNTTITCVVAGDLGSFLSSQTVSVVGSNPAVVAFGAGGHALGKNSLGSQPLGGAATTTTTLPAYFHAIPTYDATPGYLEQLSFSSKGVDLQWELISFGTNSSMTAEGNNDLKY